MVQFSPCLNPVLQSKKLVVIPFILTHDLILSYIFLMTVSSLPVMLYFSNFAHNPAHQTESNAF